MTFFEELRRRHVFRAAAAYIIVAWLILQVSDVVLDKFGVPHWMFKLILFLLCVGYPLVLVIAWAFELTPDGLEFVSKKSGEKAAETAVSPTEPVKASCEQLVQSNKQLVSIPLEEPGPHRQLAIAIRPNYPGMANVEALLQLFKEELKNTMPVCLY